MAQWLSYPTFSGPFSGQEQLLAASSTSPGAGMIRIPWSAVSGLITGTGFLPLTGGTLTGPLTLAGNATLPLQAVPLQQVQAITGGPFLQIAGGTLTGPLILAADPTLPLGAATKEYVDGAVGGGPFLPLSGGTVSGPIVLPGNATLPLQAVPLQQVTAIIGGPYLPLAGGTLTGALVLAANPTLSLGAATKQYVDSAVVSGPFLPLAGGTVTGATTFSADVTFSGASPGIAVSNNATVGGTFVATGGINGTPVGAVTPSTGSFTNLTASGTVTLPTTTTGPFLLLTGGTVSGPTTFSGSGTALDVINNASFGSINSTPIGATTPSTGKFTNLTASGTVTLPTTTALTDAIYNMLLSGAAGNGTSDDTAAIQAFLNTLPAGSEVILPAGSQFLIDSANLNLPAQITITGQGGLNNSNFLVGPAFILNPLYTINVNQGVHFNNFKILRKGLLASPTSGQVNAAVAQWASEGILLQTSASTASGNTLPFTNTTGISNGMQAYGQHLPPGGTTVVSFVANTSVTFAAVSGYPVPAGDYVRFGTSIAIHLPPNLAAFTMDRVKVMGFNTALLSEGGDMFIDTFEADCTTVLYAIHGGDTSYLSKVHCIPYYGATSGAGTMRPGPGFLLCQVDGWILETCTLVQWAVGFVLHSSGGVTLQRCWREGTPDGTTVSTGFRTEGFIQNYVSFIGCNAGASYGFDFQHTGGQIIAIGCISAVGTGDATAVSNYRLGASSSGQITSSLSIAGNEVPVVVQSGVGKWRIVALNLFGSPDPWITGASADLAMIELIGTAALDGTTSTQVQTHFNERVWLTSNTNVATVDGSPQETLAVETSYAGTGDTSILGFYKQGVRLGYIGTQVLDGRLNITGDSAGIGLAGGVSFGSNIASSNSDLSEHIALYSTTYGFGIFTSEMTYVVPSSNVHKFVVGGADQLSISAGQVRFLNSTSNWLDLNQIGLAAPAFTTRSVGTKVILYEAIGASSVDFALGVESGFLWSSVQTTSQGFKWYGGTTVAATLSGLGNLTVVNGFGLFGTSAVTSKPVVTGVKLPSDTVMASLLTALAGYGLLTDSTT